MTKNHRENNIRKVEYLKVIGENIKRYCERLDFTQEGLAKKADVGRSTVLSAEHGK